MLVFPILPGELALLLDRGVPELRRRGFVRPDYALCTMRERLGPPRLVSRDAHG